MSWRGWGDDKHINRLIDTVTLLRAENKALKDSLHEIIEQRPNPSLPYGIEIVRIARQALKEKEA